jgi:hypothetical protein
VGTLRAVDACPHSDFWSSIGITIPIKVKFELQLDIHDALYPLPADLGPIERLDCGERRRYIPKSDKQLQESESVDSGLDEWLLMPLRENETRDLLELDRI